MKKIIILCVVAFLLFSCGCASNASTEPLATFETYSLGRLDRLDLSKYTPEDAASVDRAVALLTAHYGAVDTWDEPENDIKNIERIQNLLQDDSVTDAERADLDFLLTVLS